MLDTLKMLQQVQSQMQEIQTKLQQATVTGAAAGGMVTVEADGKGAVKKVRLDPKVVNPADVEMLEDLIVVAVSDAQRRANELAEGEAKKLMGGMPLPFKLPFGG
jgi:DNA-binding YbaB/EbfC family protein